MLDPELEKSFRERPKGEREMLSETLGGITRVLLNGSSSDIAALEDKLRYEREERRPEEIDEALRDELEVRNKLRVFARYREVEERSLSGSRLQERLGVSRQRLGQLRKEKRLLGLRLPIHREVHYPLWQFGEDGRPLGVLPRLIETSKDAGMGALALDALMTNPDAVDAGDGKTAAELLRSGDTGAEEHVLGLVRTALSGGS